VKPLLVVGDVSVRIDNALLLDAIGFDVAAGEVLTVLGANGAGKSTLLATLAGELAPSTGVIELRSEPLGSYSLEALAELRALNTTEPAPSFALTVSDVVALGRPFAPTDRAALLQALAELDASAWTNREFATLSTGEQFRVQLARSRYQLGSARDCLWLLDEPCAHLDLAQRQFVLTYLRRVATEQGFAIVMTTHDPSEAQYIADRVLLMCRGAMLAFGDASSTLTAQNLSRCYDAPVTSGSAWRIATGV
jgi:iron complex transport system ATP-binding protein